MSIEGTLFYKRMQQKQQAMDREREQQRAAIGIALQGQNEMADYEELQKQRERELAKQLGASYEAADKEQPDIQYRGPDAQLYQGIGRASASGERIKGYREQGHDEKLRRMQETGATERSREDNAAAMERLREELASRERVAKVEADTAAGAARARAGAGDDPVATASKLFARATAYRATGNRNLSESTYSNKEENEALAQDNFSRADELEQAARYMMRSAGLSPDQMRAATERGSPQPTADESIPVALARPPESGSPGPTMQSDIEDIARELEKGGPGAPAESPVMEQPQGPDGPGGSGLLDIIRQRARREEQDYSYAPYGEGR
jgi:hypothetical protein